MLALIRIKILADVGVPLARIEELLDAEPDRLAAAAAEIDAALQQQIADLEHRRRRIADLAGGERPFLAPELVAFLDELRAAGVSESGVRMERDGWILLARYPDRAQRWLVEKRAQLADPGFRRIYRGFDEATDWDPADPRLERLADDLVRYLDRQGARDKAASEWDLDDPTVVQLISSHLDPVSSPGSTA